MRRLLLLVAVIVLVDTMLYAALTPLLPEYADEFGLSKTGAGLLLALYAVGVLAFGFPAGLIATRMGAKPTALTGLLVVVVASIGFAFAGEVWQLGLARFGQGLGSALAWAGGLGWLISATPRERRGEVLGTALSAAIVGALLGPVLGGAASLVGTRTAFSAVGIVAALVAVVGLREPGGVTEIPAPGSVRRALGNRAFLAGLWLMLLPAFLFGVLNVLVALDLSRLGWEGIAIGALFLTCAGFEALVNPFVGRVADRRGPLFSTRFALPAAAALSLALAWAGEPFLIAGLTLFAAIAYGTLFVPAFLLLADSADRVGLPQSLAFGIMNMGWAGGAFVGPAFGGALGDTLGDPVAYGLSALACAATLVAVLLRTRRVGTPVAEVPEHA